MKYYPVDRAVDEWLEIRSQINELKVREQDLELAILAHGTTRVQSTTGIQVICTKPSHSWKIDMSRVRRLLSHSALESCRSLVKTPAYVRVGKPKKS